MPIISSPPGANKSLSNLTNQGTSGQVLTSNGTGVAPTFQAAAGGGAAIIAPYTYNNQNFGLTRYTYPFGGALANSDGQLFPVPYAGTISNFYVKINSNTCNANTVFTVMKNGVATALTITIATGVATGSDTVNSFTCVAGDYISVKIDTTASGSGVIDFWQGSMKIA